MNDLPRYVKLRCRLAHWWRQLRPRLMEIFVCSWRDHWRKFGSWPHCARCGTWMQGYPTRGAKIRDIGRLTDDE